MHIIRRLQNLPHTKNVVINTAGNYLNFVFAGFYVVFLVRVFKPEEFGVLSVLLTLSYVLANVLSFGMPAAIYAHVPKHLPDRKRTFDFITSNFIFLTLLSGISIVVIYLFVKDVDRLFLKTGAPGYQFLLALIGTQFYVWQNFIRDTLNAAGKFLHINIALNVANIVKVILLIFLAFKNLLGITQVLFVLGIVGPVVVFVFIVLNRRWIVQAVLSSDTSRKNIQLGYTFTFFLATQLFQLATRADLFLVSFFLTRPEVGYYGLSQRIILAVVTSSDSITQVMSPQFAKITSQLQVRKMLKHSFGYMMVPTLMFVIGILLPAFVYELVFSSEYATSTMITKALSFAYLPYSFMAAGLLFFLYTIKKPTYLLGTNILFFAIIVTSNILLIPRFRLFGPSISYFVAFVLTGIYLGYAFLREFKRLPRKN